MRKYTIEDAKRLISDFCEEEYGSIADFFKKRSKHYENKLHHRN